MKNKNIKFLIASTLVVVFAMTGSVSFAEEAVPTSVDAGSGVSVTTTSAPVKRTAKVTIKNKNNKTGLKKTVSRPSLRSFFKEKKVIKKIVKKMVKKELKK